LLELFLRNPRRIFDRSALLDSIWKVNEYPGERAVTTQIKGLRQKLKSAGMTVDWLETIYGLGYRLRPEPSECSTLDEPHALTIQAQAEVEAAIQTVWLKLKETLTETFVSFDQICTQAIATDPAIANPNLDPELRQQVILEAHRLAGSLGSFGVGGSDLARHIEQLLRANTSLTPPEALQLSAWVEALKQVVNQPRHHQSPSTLQSNPQPNLQPNLQPDPLSPSPVHPPDPSYHLLLVDDDTAIAQHIQAVAQSNGFEVVVATSLTQARYRIAQTQFNLILLDLTFPETAENGLTFLEELTHQVPDIPVLVMTGCDRLIDRVKVAHLGGRAFIQKPISPAKLLETVARILAKKYIVGHRVLVVDDDPLLLQTLSALLEPWGIQVTTLNDSQQFWKTLENTEPHLLILDIEMPHFNGIELCQTVRNDPFWGEIPILFLSGHRDADIVQRVFMAGADDYVNKPIMAPELLARVLNRLQRRPIQLPSLNTGREINTDRAQVTLTF
jgi:DNA-binding response OmpR family regulator/HPt (histidine-containing phosphotransfer) domain-containing protein